MVTTITEEAIWRAALALERIATALEALIPPEPDPPSVAPCLHPQESRVDFGTTEGQADWQCRICDYRSIP